MAISLELSLISVFLFALPLVSETRKFLIICEKIDRVTKNMWISNLVFTVCFWVNFHQVPKDINRIAINHLRSPMHNGGENYLS